MKVSSVVKVGAVALALSAGAAHAGPEVAITFKNNSDVDAVYDVVSSNPATYAQADPKPKKDVAPGTSTFFKVRGAVSPDLTAAIFQYKVGNKVCKFKTSYLKLPGRYGQPKWKKSADATYGARCDVKVTSVNFTNHDWAVEFTMR